MKRVINRLLSGLLVFIALFSAQLAQGQAPAVTVYYDPTGLTPGNIINVPVVLNGTNVGIWQLLIRYNRAALTYQSTTPWSNLVFPAGLFAATPDYVLPSTTDTVYKAAWTYLAGAPGWNYSDQEIFVITFLYNGGDTQLEWANISAGSQGNDVTYTMANPFNVVNTATTYSIVYPPFVPGIIAASEVLCYNGIPALWTATPPTGGNIPYSYQWQSSPDNVTFSDIPGATDLNYQSGPLTATTYIRQKQTSASGLGDVYTNVITMTVYPQLVAGTAGLDQTICYGGTANAINATPATGGSGSYAYNWQSFDGALWSNIPGATDMTYHPGVLTASMKYRQMQTDTYCGTNPLTNVYTNEVTITVNPPLTPGTAGSDQTICYGGVPSALNASVPGGGSGLFSYNWQVYNGMVWSDIPGATDMNYQPGMLNVSTEYRQKAVDVYCGTNPYTEAFTNIVTITVHPMLVPGAAGNNQTICYGGTPSAINAANPSGGSGVFSFNWQVKNGAVWSDIPGATTMTYQPGALTATETYRQKITDDFCGTNPLTVVFTNEVTIFVHAALVAGNATADQTICNGGTPAPLNATAPTGGSGTFTYNWQVLNGSVWSDIPGASTLTYTPGVLTSTTKYRQQQTDAFCGTNPTTIVFTNEVTITVHPVMVAGTAAADQTICNGGVPAPLTATVATGGSGSFAYNWQVFDGTNWVDITGATTMTYAPGALTLTTKYRQKQTDTYCGSNPTWVLYTNEVTITVHPVMIAGTAAADQTICNGGVPAPLTATTATGGSGSFAYNWQVFDGTNWVDITGATTMTYAPGALTATTKYRQKQTDTYCGSNPTWVLYTNEVTITVHPVMVVGTAAADQTICNGGVPAPLTATAATGGSGSFAYNWQVFDGTNWVDITGATTMTYAPGALTVTTKYRQKQTDTYCGSNPTWVLYTNEVTITVHPVMVVGTAAADQTICNGGVPAPLTATAATGGSGSFAYNWQVFDGTNWVDITGATTMTYAPGALTVTTKYRQKQTDTYCGSNPTWVLYTNEVTITVHPVMIAGTAAADQTICNGGVPAPLTATVATGGSGSFAYNWQVFDGTMWSDIAGATAMTYAPGALTATTKYRQKQTDTYCGSNPTWVLYTNEVTITVHPVMVAGTAAADQTICNGGVPAPLTATAATGGSGSFAYNWQVFDGTMWSDIAGATAMTYAPGALTATTKYRQKQTDTYCGSNPTWVLYTNEVTITVYPVMVAGTAAADQTICNGGVPAPLTATAATGGSGSFAYNWQVFDGTNWVDITGATTMTYAPGALTVTTKYRQKQTDTYCGSNPTWILYTNEVTITVYPVMVAGTAAADQTICNGGVPAPLTATAATGGSGSFAYNWQVFDGTNWVDITGATTMTYAPGALTATTKYRQKQTDTYCGSNPNTVLYTNEVTITVYPVMVAGTAAADQTICNGGVPAPLTATAATGGSGSFAYNWQVFDGTNWVDITGATTMTYAPGALTVTTKYRQKQTDTYCGSNPTTVLYTNEVTITVYPVMVAGTAAADQTICNGGVPAPLTATAATGGSGSFAYNWQVFDGTNWVDITGATTMTYAPGALTATTKYRQKQTDTYCGSNPTTVLYTNEVTITVYPVMVAGTAAADQTICNGGVPAPLTATAATGGSGSFAYNWQVFDGTNWVDITGATTMTYAPGALTATTKYRQKQTDTYCGSNPTTVLYTNEVTITVYPVMVAGTAAADQTICNGGVPAPLTATAATGGSGSFTYNWQVFDGATWSDIPGATAMTYAPGALTVTTKYRQKQTDTYCGSNPTTVVYTNEVTIIVHPAMVPGTAAADQTICNGGVPAPLTATPANGGSGSFAYNWQVYSGTIWSDIPGATAMTYAPGALTVTTKYRQKQTDTFCGGNPTTVGFTNEVTITVHPAMVPGTAAADQTICYGGTPAPLTATAPTGGSGTFTYNWQVLGGSVWSNIPGATAMTYAPGALTVTTKYRQMQTDAFCGANPTTIGYTNEVTITVHPMMVAGTAGADQTICNGGVPAPLTATAPTGGSGTFAYNWQVFDGATWSDIPGATAMTYAPGALTVTTKYRQKQTDTFCGSNPATVVYTNEVTITVYPVMVAGTAAADQTICNGGVPAPLTATAATGGSGTFAYNWQVFDGTNWVDIAGATTMTYAPGVLTATTKYRQKQTDTFCGSNPTTMVYTNEVTITVHPVMVAGTAAANQAICYGTAPAPLTATAATGGSGTFAYNWQVFDGSAWVDIAGATGMTYAPGILTVTTKYRQKQTDTFCGSNPSTVVYTNEVTITVNPLPVPTITGPVSACVNSTGNIYTTEAGMTGYTWSVTGGTIIGSSAGNSINVTWTTVGAQSVSVNYTDGNGCTAATPTVLAVTVNPLPVVTAVGLQYSTTGTAPWNPVNGTLAGGYDLCIDPMIPYYYLDINNLTVTVPLSSAGFVQNGFKLNTSSLPPTWTSYWDAKGVNASATPGTWQAVMYQIILGNQPMYYISYTGTDYLLIDGLQYQFGGVVDILRVSGDYPQWGYTYFGSVTDINGCVSPQMNILMTFNTVPVPTITGPASVCVNSTGNIYTTEAGMTGYTWSVTGGTIVGSSTGNSINVTWNAVGAQSVSVNYTDPNGCTAGAPTVYAVTVNPLPVPTITGPTPVCATTAGNVYTTQAGMTGYTWVVSAGGTITAGGTSTDNTVTVTWNTAGAQSVSVNYIDGNGCTAAVPTVYAVIVNPLPVPTIAGPASVCQNSTGNVYTTQTGMTGYTWTVSAGGTITAGGTSTDNTVTVTWNTVGAQTVSVNYTNGNGCTGAAPAVYAVTVNPLPVPTITGPIAACVNSTGNIYTTQTGMTGYTWTVVGGTIVGSSTGNSISVTWNTVGAQSVSVNYIDPNGCTAPVPTVLAVTVNPLPVPTITGPATACNFSTGNIYTTEAGMTGYIWTVVGGTITAGSGTNAVTVTWNTVGAQSISVNYTNANGCTAAVPTVKAVTVYALPTPTINGLATVCAQTTGVAYATEPGMTGYTWAISAGGTITSGAGTNSILVTWTTAGPQTLSVNYTNANGCQALTPTVYNVTVNALPVPTITGPNSICVNTTNNVYTTEAGMTNYTWTVSAGGTITSGAASNAITVTWSTSGAKTVSVNYYNANNCTALTPTVYNVTVNPLPVPTITGNNNLCKGATNVVYTTQSGMTNYIWTVSAGGTITAGGTSTSNSVTVTWHTAGVQAVTVNYTNANGCTAVAPTSYSVTVNPTPTPTIGSNNTPCVNSTNNMYYTESGQTGYVWTVSSGGVITSGQGTSAIHVTWNVAGAQFVTVNYNNSFGCTAPTPTVYNLFVNPLPGPAGPITGTAVVCAGTNGVAYSTTPVTNAITYTWTLPAGATIASGAGTTNITVNFGPNAVSGKIYVAGTNGCGNGEQSSFDVTVNPLPAAAGTISGPATVCAGTNGVVYSVPPIANATGYGWTVPTGMTIVSGGNTNQITVNVGLTPGTGQITVKGTNACGSGTTSSLNVTIKAVPDAPVVTVNGNVLTSSSPVGNQWYYEGVAIPGATGQTYVVTHNTGYYWCVVTIEGCSSGISNKVWVEIVGVPELPADASFVVYPVPNDGLFTASVSYPVEDTFTIAVFNQLGQKIYELKDIRTTGGKIDQQIDLRPVRSGMYSVVFTNQEHKVVKKVLIRN